jgi:ATP-dependent DNA helicase Rep
LRQLQNALLPFNDQPIQVFLDHVARIAEQQYYDPAADAVALMTIHASKGLEFPHVFLVGAEDGILPYAREHEAANLAEERRLLYVAVSRAAESLDILHTRQRAGQQSTLSPFLRDLPLAMLVDPNLEVHKRAAEKRRQKKAQTSLF